MEHKLFFEITSVFLLAGIVSLIVSYFKQPSIIAFIITGLLVGPFGYTQLKGTGTLETLGEIGITLLLFMVGLELDLKKLKEMGRVSLFSGLGQILFSFLIGTFICVSFGLSFTVSALIAICLTFSSTIIVVKIISEKKDTQALYARLVVGILIVQDIAALVLMIFFSSQEQTGVWANLPNWQQLLNLFVKILILTLALAWLSKQAFPKFLDRFGKSEDTLLVFVLAWVLGFAAFMSMPFIGFSLETGGFLAGLALANSQVHYEISAKIKSIRDFFLIIFFIVFGSQLYFGLNINMLWLSLALAVYVLCIQPLLVTALLCLMKFKLRTAFFAGLAIGQISEFGLVLAAIANKQGLISNSETALVTLVGVVSIAVSSYLLLNADKVFTKVKKYIFWLEFHKNHDLENSLNKELKNHTVLVGAHRLGEHILRSLQKMRTSLIIVDFDPIVCTRLSNEGFYVICGDIADSYIQEQANLLNAKLIISTTPDLKDNLSILELLQGARLKKMPKVIIAAQNEEEARHLYEKKVDYVISPHFIGGMHIAKILEEDISLSGLKSLRNKHLKEL